MDGNTRKKLIVRVGIVSICGNLLLCIGKAVAAVCTGSDAMAGDCLHTVSDIATTVIALLGCVWAARKADDGHPYGHEKLEYIAAILLGAALAFVGVSQIKTGVVAVWQGGNTISKGGMAVAAAVASIALKEGMFWYTRYYAKRTGSGALHADAWHHRSDALSSVGSLAGVICSMAGVPLGDSIAAVCIGILIVASGVGVVYTSAAHVDDHAARFAPVSAMVSAALSVDGVLAAHVTRTRMHGNMFFADMTIEVDADATVERAYKVAAAVHDAVEQAVELCKHVAVSVAPHGGDWEGNK